MFDFGKLGDLAGSLSSGNLGDLGDKLKSAVSGGGLGGLGDMVKSTAINTALQGVLKVLNSRIERYGTVDSLKVRDGGGLTASVALLGLSQKLDIDVPNIHFSDDISTVSISGVKSNIAFLDNLCNDFLNNKTIPLNNLPDSAKMVIKGLKGSVWN